MIKLTKTLSANVNVIDEAKLGQVVGGHGRCGGYRKNYGHGYKNRRDNDNYGGGYESKGYGDDSYDSDSSYDDNYKYGCERKYS